MTQPPPIPPQQPPLPPSAPPAPPVVPAKKPFAYQAAQFSCVAPIVAVVISVVTNGAFRENTSPSSAELNGIATLMIASLNMLLIVTSFIMGIIALAAIPRLGTKYILGRALTGVIISTIFIVAAVSLLFILKPPARLIEKRIAGDWDSTVATAAGIAHARMSLDPKGSARFQFLDGPVTLNSPGIWHVVTPGGKLPGILELKFDTPITLNPSHPIPVLSWQLDHVTDEQLDLLTNDASGKPIHELYTRHH